MADEDWKQRVYERISDRASDDAWTLSKILEVFPSSSLKKSDLRNLLEQDEHFRFLVIDEMVFPFIYHEDIEQKGSKYFAEHLYLRFTQSNTPVIGVTTFRNIIKRINKQSTESTIDLILDFIAKDDRFIVQGKKNQAQAISLNADIVKKTSADPTPAAPMKSVTVPKVEDEKPLINCFHKFSYFFKQKVWSLAVIREIFGKGYPKLENSVRSNRKLWYYFNDDAICTIDEDMDEIIATIILGTLLYTEQAQVSLVEVAEELKKMDRKKQLQFSDTAIDTILARAPLQFSRKGKTSGFTLAKDKSTLLLQQEKVSIEDFPALLLDYLTHLLTTVSPWKKGIRYNQLFEHYPIFAFHSHSWQRLLTMDTRFVVTTDGIITINPSMKKKLEIHNPTVATSIKKPNGADSKENGEKESSSKEMEKNVIESEEVKRQVFYWLRGVKKEYPNGVPLAEVYNQFHSITKRNVKSILGLDEQMRFIIVKDKVYPFVPSTKAQQSFEKAAYYLYYLIKPLSPPSLPFNTVPNTLLQSTERVKKQEMNSFMDYLQTFELLEITGSVGREKLVIKSSNVKAEKAKISSHVEHSSSHSPVAAPKTVSTGISAVSDLLDRLQPSAPSSLHKTVSKDEKLQAKKEKAARNQIIKQHEEMAIHHALKSEALPPQYQQLQQQPPQVPSHVEEFFPIAKVLDISATANRYQNFDNEIPYESLCLHSERPFNAFLFQQESYQSLSRLLSVVGMRSNSSPRNLVVLDQNPELFLSDCVSVQGHVIISVSPLVFSEAQRQFGHRANVTVKPFLLSWSTFTIKTLLTFLNLDIAAAAMTSRSDSDYALLRFLCETYPQNEQGGQLPPFSEFLSHFSTHYSGEKQRILFLLETFIQESEKNQKYTLLKEEVMEDAAADVIHILNLSDHHGLLSPRDIEGVYCYHLFQFMTTKTTSKEKLLPSEPLHVDNIIVLNDLAVSLEESYHPRQLYVNKTRLREMFEIASLHHTSVLIRQSAVPTALDPLLLSSFDFSIVSSLSFASLAKHWQTHIERMLNYSCGLPSIKGSTLVIMNFRSLNMFLLRSAAGMQLIDQLSLPIDY